jgi:hypothetical protein
VEENITDWYMTEARENVGTQLAMARKPEAWNMAAT